MDKHIYNEVIAEYGADPNAIILTPGKFERETIAAPYFYGVAMEGGAVYISENIDAIEIDNSERSAFNLSSEDIYAIVKYSENGFIDLEYCTLIGLSLLKGEIAQENDDSYSDNDD